jgi:hypothetical protein
MCLCGRGAATDIDAVRGQSVVVVEEACMDDFQNAFVTRNTAAQPIK